jgi:biotin carboxyl carrier protein
MMEELTLNWRPVLLGIALSLLCLVILLNAQWAPSYPIQAKVFYQPELISVKAPIDGFVKKIHIHEGAFLHQGQKILDIENAHALMMDTYHRQKLKAWSKKAEKLKAELDYQKNWLKKIRLLANKALISEQEFHQKKLQYQQLLFEYHDVRGQIKDVEHEHFMSIQSPITGEVLELGHRLGAAVEKEKHLLWIKPIQAFLWVKIKLPIQYQKEVYLGQFIKLSEPGESCLHTYPIEGIVLDISKFTHVKDKHLYYFWVKAKLTTTDIKLLQDMPLKGYLLGRPKKIWSWLTTIWG